MKTRIEEINQTALDALTTGNCKELFETVSFIGRGAYDKFEQRLANAEIKAAFQEWKAQKKANASPAVSKGTRKNGIANLMSKVEKFADGASAEVKEAQLNCIREALGIIENSKKANKKVSKKENSIIKFLAKLSADEMKVLLEKAGK